MPVRYGPLNTAPTTSGANVPCVHTAIAFREVPAASARPDA